MRIRRAWVRGLGRELSRHELRQLRSVWESVPHVRCKGLCADSCKQVPLFPVEAFYLIEKHGAQIEPGAHPRFLQGQDPFTTPTLGSGKPCQYLKEGRCSIYNDRPIVCRVFGHPTATLSCAHGCTVKNPLDGYRVGELFFRTARILNPEVPANPKTPEEYRAAFDVLYAQWDEMELLAEVLEEGEEDDEPVR